MYELEIYNSIRQEIVSNHILMHWFTLIILALLLGGVFIVEKRDSILSVFLPLLSVAWAASTLRFDFFIHRQNAYLRHIEPQLQKSGLNFPLWESWNNSLTATKVVIPAADIAIFLMIGTITCYLLFVPAKRYFKGRGWKRYGVYAWSVVFLLLLLLSSLALVPTIAAW